MVHVIEFAILPQEMQVDGGLELLNLMFMKAPIILTAQVQDMPHLLLLIPYQYPAILQEIHQFQVAVRVLQDTAN